MPRTRIVLVTGATSGIGEACAELLPLYGFRVYAAARSSAEFPLDITSDTSVQSAVDRIIAAEGRIDAVVNNAGIGLAGAVEETTPSEANLQFDTNFFGQLRVIRAVLPCMRERKSGYIVNIGSIGGLIAIPYQGLYSASKFALEGLTEALRLEVKQFGIHATIVEPGDHRTAFTQNRRLTAASSSASPYSTSRERALSRMAKDEQAGPDPVGVARVVLKVLLAPSPRLRYTTGPSLQRTAAALKRYAPNSLLERIMRFYYS